MLHVTLSGKVIPALEEKEMDLGWAIPSPNGRDVAIWMSAAQLQRLPSRRFLVSV